MTDCFVWVSVEMSEERDTVCVCACVRVYVCVCVCVCVLRGEVFVQRSPAAAKFSMRI